MMPMTPPYTPSRTRRRVHLAAWSLFCPAGIGAAGLSGGAPGAVPGFKARSWIKDRKSLKLMGRSVQLGVAAVSAALSGVDGWEQIPPCRRAIFVGASPELGDPDDLSYALNAASEGGSFDLQAFAEKGIGLIHPLWLVRGLSNNVIGFASAFHDLQGVNANYCDGRRGGWNALTEGIEAVAEGRADIVVAGGADSFVGAEALVGVPCGEAAAFVVLRPAADDESEVFAGDPAALQGIEDELGYLGAAAAPVAWLRAHCSA
jgi:hypothetical protein